MEKYSVWSFPCCKRYYLTHPWKWFKDLKDIIKDVYRRAVYGWTWTDCWNWDYWFIHTTPAMFRHMAKEGMAYPGTEPFDTPEKWHEWLNKMADLIESAGDDWQDKHNEYYEEYMEHLTDKWRPMKVDENGNYRHEPMEQTELDKKFYARAKELAEIGNDNIKIALNQISKHFPSIWD